MKIRQLEARTTSDRSSERGTAVIIVIAFLSILLVYLATNIMTLSRLGHELRLLEQMQTRRLARQVAMTNAVPRAAETKR